MKAARHRRLIRLVTLQAQALALPRLQLQVLKPAFSTNRITNRHAAHSCPARNTRIIGLSRDEMSRWTCARAGTLQGSAPEKIPEDGDVHAGVAAQVEAAQLGVRQLPDRRGPEIQARLRQQRRRWRGVQPRAVHRPRQRVVVEHHDLPVLRLLQRRHLSGGPFTASRRGEAAQLSPGEQTITVPTRRDADSALSHSGAATRCLYAPT